MQRHSSLELLPHTITNRMVLTGHNKTKIVAERDNLQLTSSTAGQPLLRSRDGPEFTRMRPRAASSNGRVKPLRWTSTETPDPTTSPRGTTTSTERLPTCGRLPSSIGIQSQSTPSRANNMTSRSILCTFQSTRLKTTTTDIQLPFLVSCST